MLGIYIFRDVKVFILNKNVEWIVTNTKLSTTRILYGINVYWEDIPMILILLTIHITKLRWEKKHYLDVNSARLVRCPK